MDIRLSKVKVFDELSQETIAFTAEVFIGDKKVASARNDGGGGMTMLHPVDVAGQQLIIEAEKWLKEPQTGAKVGKFYNLSDYVDALLTPYLAALDKADYERTVRKEMNKGILYGEPYVSLFCRPLSNTVNQICATEAGMNTLMKAIKDDIVPEFKDGWKILNQNLPKQLTSQFPPETFLHLPNKKHRVVSNDPVGKGKAKKK